MNIATLKEFKNVDELYLSVATPHFKEQLSANEKSESAYFDYF